MKIAIASDLHLEFGKISLENTQNADVLVLAGDVTTANKPHVSFFEDCAEKFPHVIYVVGNHEHYYFDFKYTVSELKKELSHISNLKLLDKEVARINDVMFVGGTMWTDMNGGSNETMRHVERRMSDHHMIVNSNRMVSRKVPIYEKNPLWTSDGRNGGQYSNDKDGYYIKIGEKTKEEPARFSPEDAVVENDKFKDYLRIATDFIGESSQKFVVVTHHTPSQLSCHPRFKAYEDMNHAYHNNLDDFILDRRHIKLWIHGHTHDDFDYMIGTCRVVCNPRGYDGHEKRADTWRLKYVEV